MKLVLYPTICSSCHLTSFTDSVHRGDYNLRAKL